MLLYELLMRDEHPDPEPPPWQRTPWWYGNAKRDHILLGFILAILGVTVMIFGLIMWSMG